MLFRVLGQTISRAWPLFLAGWAILLLALWYFAPPWEQVAQDQEFAFLPADSPSRRAGEVYAKAFPEDQYGSNIVLVLHRPDASPKRLEGDLKFIEEVLEPGLRKIAEDEGGLAGQPAITDDSPFGSEEKPAVAPKPRSVIARIRTPNALGYGALLVSPDQRALLVVLELTTEFLATGNRPTIEKVEELTQSLRRQEKLPAGASLAVTGSAVIGRDQADAQLRGVRATEVLTVVLVVVLLLIIYRAPLLALIPLATVVVAVQVSLHLLAILAQAGYINVFGSVKIYVTILAYGAGVDYCLFLTARYREELNHGAAPATALVTAISGVGSALVASAATVMCGIAMMMFAEFGKFREAGFAIPLSLGMVLVATLTFSPALLRLAGRWAFWPDPLGKAAAVAQLAAPSGWTGYLRSGLLRRLWDDVGHALVRRPLTIWLVAVAVMAPFAIAALLLYNHLSYDIIGDLPADAPSVAGSRVLREHFSAGMLGPVTVVVVAPKVDFTKPEGEEFAARLTNRLRDRREELGLTDVRTLTAPLGIAQSPFQAIGGFGLAKNVDPKVIREKTLERYTTSLGERTRTGMRLDLILKQSPFTRWSTQDLDAIEETLREALPAEHQEGTTFHIVGATASVRDLAAVMQRDRTRIELLVLVSVFVILLLLLRQVLVPVYLLVSVLFSYYATLGVAFLVFWLLDPQGFTGIDWKVAIFLFTILIAVGEDYNIFLLTRVHEEEKRHGPIRGITEALTRTGPIISSCGIIMAGTFAALLAGTLTEMKQLGFALAFGVLLDTFVVRPILVPAFLILLARVRLPLPGREQTPREETLAPR